MFAVKTQLFDGRTDIDKRPVGFLRLGEFFAVRMPALDEFLDRADINVAVMEIFVKFRHPFDQKPPVMMDAAAAKRRFMHHAIFAHETERALFGGLHGHARLFDLLDQSRFLMLFLIPRIHAFQDFGLLMNDQIGPFGNNIQLAVGDNRGGFDDQFLFGIKPRHLKVNPDKVLGIFLLCHADSIHKVSDNLINFESLGEILQERMR